MTKNECSSCLRVTHTLTCDLCQNPCCKSCTVFVDEDLFEMPAMLPKNLQDKAMCALCYQSDAAHIIDNYNEILERAKSVNVYDMLQTHETYKMNRHEKAVIVQECNDREETLMRLAFLAAQRGFNTLVDVNIQSKKISQGGTYKKLVWSGKGIPLNR